jgi:hypothetical protein
MSIFSKLTFSNLRARTFKCPLCNAEIPYFDVNISLGRYWKQETFQCRTCKYILCVPKTYAWAVTGGGILASILIPLLLGIRPWILFLVVVLLGQFIVGMLAAWFIKVFFPPKILPFYGDDLSIRGPLRGA